MNFKKKIEDTVLSHIVSILIGSPATIFPVLWKLLGVMGALLGTSLVTVMILVVYVILLKSQLKTKPDFTPFIHSPDKGCWVNKTTGERICETCKAENKLVPLSRCGDGWKCPTHPNVVDYPQTNGPAYYGY